MEEKEIWKDIIGYDGIYQISSLGNVKSLPREIFNCRRSYISKEKILKPSKDGWGYLKVVLYYNGSKKNFKIHQLVAMAFLNHKPDGTQNLVVDHINDVKTDNRVENLQIVTQRYNCCKTQGRYTSKFKGVDWFKKRNKWRAAITINGKRKHLGLFNCEEEAAKAYQNKLKETI
jgi:hypothetical protein